MTTYMKIQTSDREYKLNYKGYKILEYLDTVGVGTEEAIRTAVRQGHAFQTIQGLERAGLIEKEADRYSLTMAGSNTYSSAKKIGGLHRTHAEKDIENGKMYIQELGKLVRDSPKKATKLLVRHIEEIVQLRNGYTMGVNNASESELNAMRKEARRRVQSCIRSLRRDRD